MRVLNFIKQQLNWNNKDQRRNDDLKLQIKNSAESLIAEYQSYPDVLDFSIKSLKIIDSIILINQQTKKGNLIEITEKITSYILVTFDENFKGEILWSDHKNQPVFIIDNTTFDEFYPIDYVKNRLQKTIDSNSLEKIIETFLKEKNHSKIRNDYNNYKESISPNQYKNR